MPIFPPPSSMVWQLFVQPYQYLRDFRRPFYVNARNNLPGGPQPLPKPTPKPAPIVHAPKQTKAEALAAGSIGTAVGGPTTSSYLKVMDLPPGAPNSAGLALSGPSQGSAPTNDVRPFQKDTDRPE